MSDRTMVEAFNARYELCGPFDDDWQELCLAAALRAAADELRIEMTATACVNRLYRIAAELENPPMTNPDYKALCAEHLSPAAQAVLDAFAREARPEPRHQNEAIAAVLRAAADQVVPEVTREPHGNGFRWGGWSGIQGVRRDLLAIATELEAQP
jgi:hypothetical protein